jgi:hypothetical protein
MKIGFDIHGVIDKHPELFKEISDRYVQAGHEIHILTGQEWEIVKHQVAMAGVKFHKYFSIVDHHKEVGTKMYQRTDREGWWMDSLSWDCSKGNYALINQLDIHFDDDLKYATYFPNTCTFIHVPAYGFEKVYRNILNLSLTNK